MKITPVRMLINVLMYTQVQSFPRSDVLVNVDTRVSCPPMLCVFVYFVFIIIIIVFVGTLTKGSKMQKCI